MKLSALPKGTETDGIYKCPDYSRMSPMCCEFPARVLSGWTVGHSVFPAQTDGSSIRWWQTIKSELSSSYSHRSRVLQRRLASEKRFPYQPQRYIMLKEYIRGGFIPRSLLPSESHERIHDESVSHAYTTLEYNETFLIGGFSSDCSQIAAKWESTSDWLSGMREHKEAATNWGYN